MTLYESTVLNGFCFSAEIADNRGQQLPMKFVSNGMTALDAQLTSAW
jgi:hypothetical protein